jgi:hypothetical protein
MRSLGNVDGNVGVEISDQNCLSQSSSHAFDISS